MGSGCYGSSCCSSGRGFLTRAEKIELLSDYKKQLDNESLGVSEHIKALEQSSDDE